MEILNLIDLLFSHIMIIEFVPQHWVLLQIPSKTLIMASLNSGPYMQHKCIQFIYVICCHYFWQYIFKVQTKLEI